MKVVHPDVLIFSHRGLDFGHENTLGAFRGALEAGCGLELDVRLTRDNNIVIIHDNDLKHGAGVDKQIGDLTVEEIKQHGLFKTEERVPTFDELATLLQESPVPPDAIAIHLKLPEQTEPLMTLLADKIAEHELEDEVFIFDVTRPAIDYLITCNPNLRLAISLGADHHAPTIFTMDDLPQFPDVPIIWWDEWGEANGQSYAGKLYSEATLHSLKEKNLKVYAISPDVAYQSKHPLAHDHKYVPVWKDMVAWGVDGICTDQSQELIAFLRSKKL